MWKEEDRGGRTGKREEGRGKREEGRGKRRKDDYGKEGRKRRGSVPQMSPGVEYSA